MQSEFAGDDLMKNIIRRIKKASGTFRKYAGKNFSGWLTDNFYILEGSASESLKECRKIQRTADGPDVFPGLFDTCLELCGGGVLPAEDELVEKLMLKCRSSTECLLLPLAVTCALIIKGEEGAKEDNGLLAESIKSLRRLAETDFESISERLNQSEPVLNCDPSGIYPVMSGKTKAQYRRAVAIGAKKKRMTEKEFAEKALKKAKEKNEHIGFFIMPEKNRRRRGILYLAAEAVFPAFCAAAAGILMKSISLPFIVYLPLWQILRPLIISASLNGIDPKPIFSLDTDSKKSMAETLIAVSTIMPNPEKAVECAEHLENVFLSSRCSGIKICCLADLKSASKPVMPEDKASIKAMTNAIDALNRKYGGGFLLAVRGRAYSETQEEFTGKERKRGAITELVRAIKGEASGFTVLSGDKSTLHSTEFLVCLDADTMPEFDGIRKLVSAAVHPLNKPVIDDKKGRVVSGYGILVPKSVNSLGGEKRSLFAKIISGESGLSVYESGSSERYYDLFGEALFCGKGLINVNAYYRLLNDNLPKERILSHDILEGGYLRAGFMPEVQMTDGIPQSPIAYFLRLERWIRGDWQNMPFIFGKNPLNALSRFKLFDNLRRSITPVICIASVLAAVFNHSPYSAAICIISILAIASDEIFSGIGAVFHNGFSTLSALFYSQTLPAALGAFSRAFVSLAFSAREAFVSLCAICKALFRMIFSKKKLLEWTTAAGGEKKNSFSKKIKGCIPAALIAAVLLIFGSAAHRLIGFFLIFDIPLGLLSDKPIKLKKGELSEDNREILKNYTASAWNFFDEHCSAENNYLPPDNIQFSPVRAVAHRTSPTNIGLMLVSVLAARDMGFITTSEMCARLNLAVTSIEKLEKYHGNLLNWYDTKTLRPLEPKFVSTVDSGNFVCSLVTLNRGLKEYAAEYPQMNGLSERIRKLIDETDLRPMYNSGRNLFYIGIEPETERRSEGCYDLFMSEARMTAYFAVAKRMIPKKHWGAMGRIIVSSGRHSGLVSWTGTAFEYFMPLMFIPSPVGSFTNESLHFCLYCQKKRSGKRPFGVSESGFYAFDSELNYQYKAHGVQKIGLRRGLNEDYVVSPYSSFLMLQLAPETSMKNLKRLERRGMNGKFGFYEAADYTRSSENGDFSLVSSYMAHHVGMSIISADNALNENIMQKRFMSDADMRGAASLLDEKIPTGAKPFKDIRPMEIPKIRERVQNENSVYENPDPFEPECAVYSNGRMSCFISDCGTGVTIFDGVDLNVRETDIISRPQGVFAVFAGEDGIYPFTKALSDGGEMKYSCEFLRDRAVHKAENDKMLLQMATKILKHSDCEIISFKIVNKSHGRLNGRLFIYYEPCIEKNDVYSRHPAFSKLFIEDDFNESAGCMTFRRRNTDESAAIAVGLKNTEKVKFTADREKVLNSPKGVFSIGEKQIKEYEKGNPDCCCAFEIPVDLAEKETKRSEMIISADENIDSAVSTFSAVKAGKADKKYAFGPFGCDAVTSALSKRLLPSVMYPKKNVVKTERNFSIGDLWSLGISGDIPIISLGIKSADETDEILPYLRFNKLIRSCGMPVDLAIIYADSDGYFNPVSVKIKQMLNSENCALMMGIKGGVHLLNSARQSYESLSALSNLSAVFTESGKDIAQRRKSDDPVHRTVLNLQTEKNAESTKLVKQYNFTNGKISIKKGSYSVDIPWVHIISGKNFGTIVSDKSIGFTWALNSGENKITPWYNDNMSDNRGERILLRKNGRIYDVAAISDVVFMPGKAVWSCTVDGLKIEAEISVPERSMVKFCRIKTENTGQTESGFELIYYLVPVLGSGEKRAGCFSIKKIENGCIFSNHLSPVKGCAMLKCSEKSDVIVSEKEIYSADENSGVCDGSCIAVGRKVNLPPGEKNETDFSLSWGASEKAAALMPETEDVRSESIEKAIESGNEEIDKFYNSFLYSQVKRCRFYARTGFYQCSGAYGFRDQLQDSLAFLRTEPELTRIHLIRCAAVQFEEGDVLHWWHVTVNSTAEISGIRTKCSDDMLWMPYVFCEYLKITGDKSLAELRIPYIRGEILPAGEKERYFQPERSEMKESFLMHCIRAVEKSLNFGENGLPLIGSCDWNDAFSNAGDDEKGESVWLGMFQIIVLRRMSMVCTEFGMREKADEFNRIADKLVSITEKVAWDSDRYIRAILKDGVKLGRNREFIDILPQAFSAFAGDFDPERVRTALNTAYDKLFDGENSVIKLLTPAFDEYERESVGYIAAYPPGIRENGGQYTHGAVWLTMAMFRIGENEKAIRLLEALIPSIRYCDEEKAKKYRAEPYVLAGDVGIDGRAGWTHFTGSAGWLGKCIEENIKAIRNHYKAF